jgi:hypothetical protein
MKHLKTSRLYVREAAALAHLIDRRRLLRELRRVKHIHAYADSIDGAFIWDGQPQGFAFWAQLGTRSRNNPAVAHFIVRG